jgi:vacuolar-type H+-ATPase subunit I/STV1
MRINKLGLIIGEVACVLMALTFMFGVEPRLSLLGIILGAVFLGFGVVALIIYKTDKTRE